MQMLIAAMPSLPMPWPTNIPSMAVTADVLSIPSSVGMKNFLNSLNTFNVLKSIASLFILMFFIWLYNISCVPTNEKVPDKMIGFTQSSCPALMSMPSDEDYKTLFR